MSPTVRTARLHSSLREAAQMMADIDVGVLPVADADRLVGMIQ